MRMILDGMGGDLAPASVVEGAVLALKEMEHEIVFVGQKELIEQELKKYTYDKNRISIVDAREVISNDEAPVKAVRFQERFFNRKRDQYGQKRRRRHFYFSRKHRSTAFWWPFHLGKESRGLTGRHWHPFIRS